MNVWAIVPVKPLNRAKSRLAEVLSPEEREQLATGMLERTIRLLLPMPEIQGVLVISRDTKALALVRDLGAQTVQESGNPELNKALYRATSALPGFGAGAVLVVPADLPLLQAEDVASIVTLGRYPRTVVLAPDRREGRHQSVVRPPGLIPYAFGGPSFEEHQRWRARPVRRCIFIVQSGPGWIWTWQTICSRTTGRRAVGRDGNSASAARAGCSATRS